MSLHKRGSYFFLQKTRTCKKRSNTFESTSCTCKNYQIWNFTCMLHTNINMPANTLRNGSQRSTTVIIHANSSPLGHKCTEEPHRATWSIQHGWLHSTISSSCNGRYRHSSQTVSTADVHCTRCCTPIHTDKSVLYLESFPLYLWFYWLFPLQP
jgi:hypothetical protein